MTVCTGAALLREPMVSGTEERITRDSLEEALSDLQGDIDRETKPLLTRIAYAAGGAAGVLVGIAYLLGRRAGRKRSAIVEVRRI